MSWLEDNFDSMPSCLQRVYLNFPETFETFLNSITPSEIKRNIENTGYFEVRGCIPWFKPIVSYGMMKTPDAMYITSEGESPYLPTTEYLKYEILEFNLIECLDILAYKEKIRKYSEDPKFVMLKNSGGVQ